ncbi:MAG: ATP-grasp domain-containing protein [Methanopyri archaeon]|nr:ATP-grasp domain-containing protein [Methanopyri archaeon]
MGVTNGGLAGDALAAGLRPASVQFYDPEDQPGVTVTYILERPGTYIPRFRPPPPRWIEEALSELGPEIVVPTAEFAHGPADSSGLEVAGNDPGTVEEVSDKLRLYERLSDRVEMPETSEDPDDVRSRPVVVKPRRGSAGLGVRVVEEPEPLGEGWIYQEYVDGVHLSLTFVSDGSEQVPLSINGQLVDLERPGYSYVGNSVPAPEHLNPRVREELSRIADVVVEEFGLVGINGIDVVLSSEGVYLIEVNPRPPAPVNAMRRALGVNPAVLHLEACEGRLEVEPFPRPKAWAVREVVYAPSDVRVPKLPDWVGDRPRPGVLVPRGEPVCTVTAYCSTPSSAMAVARRLSSTVRGLLEPVSSTPPTEGWY